MKLSWVGNALLATICLIPMFVGTGAVSRIFGTKPIITAIYWTGASTVGMLAYLVARGQTSELALNGGTWLIIALGLTLGALANIGIFQALAMAPNPGLPVAIVSTNSIWTFIIVLALAKHWPRAFAQNNFSVQHAFALLLILAGTILFSIKK